MREPERAALAARALAAGEADACEVIVHAEDLALTRFTHNAVHQNLASSDVTVRIRAVQDGRVGVAQTNDLCTEALRAAAGRALASARLAPPDPAFRGLVQALAAPRAVGAYAERTADASPQTRADLAARVFAVMEANDLWAAGYASTARSGVTIANSRGTRASFDGTTAALNVKATGPDATGYAEALATDVAAIDATAVARVAADKARASAAPIAVDPGSWTVVLEPAAFGELFSYLTGNFSAQTIAEGSSCFAAGIDRPYACEAVTVAEDPGHPLAPGMPFDWEGAPTRRTILLERGVLRGCLTDAAWAAKRGTANTGNALPAPNPYGPQAMHVVVAPGTRALADLIASTERGLLVSRFWYIRPVDQRKTIVTGMTRDGTFLIENGRIAGGVKNLRFNQSILEALGRCEFSSEQRRTGGYGYETVVPGARIEGFRFTGATAF